MTLVTMKYTGEPRLIMGSSEILEGWYKSVIEPALLEKNITVDRAIQFKGDFIFQAKDYIPRSFFKEEAEALGGKVVFEVEITG